MRSIHAFNILAISASIGLCSMATAQVIQLPTYRVFTLGTTVVVPDGGSAVLGSSSYYREGSRSQGIPILGKAPGLAPAFGSRAVEREIGYARSSVHVQVIDLEQMDREVLAEAARRRKEMLRQGEAAVQGGDQGKAAILNKARFLSQHMGRRP